MTDVSLDNLEAAWKGTPPLTKEDDVAEKIVDESEKHYKDVNVCYMFSQIAMESEKIRDGKVSVKNNQIEEVRKKIGTLTDFLDKAYIAMGATTTDTIQMTEHAELLFDLKGMLPEHAAKLIGDKTTFKRKELEMLCQMMTRRIDSEYAPKIEELKEDVMDVMQLLDKLLPILKDLVKKYDDHIKYMLRQAR